jgi:hypothetical protein
VCKNYCINITLCIFCVILIVLYENCHELACRNLENDATSSPMTSHHSLSSSWQEGVTIRIMPSVEISMIQQISRQGHAGWEQLNPSSPAAGLPVKQPCGTAMSGLGGNAWTSCVNYGLTLRA